MERSFIQEGLSKFVDELTSQTYLDTFRCQKRSSLLAEGLGTRANSIWKMANYIVAYKEENEKEEHNVEKEFFLKGWSELCKNYKNQYLILEVDGEKNWEMYDSYGNFLGGNEFIKDYLAKQTPKKANTGNKEHDTDTEFLSRKQVIYFGSPGTGKSFGIKKRLRKHGIIEDPKDQEERRGCDRLFRTTFHPDTDYASFVGCYKPTKSKGVILSAPKTEREIAEAFIDAYCSKPKNAAILQFGVKYSKYFNGEISELNKKDIIEKAKEIAKNERGITINGDEWHTEVNKGVNLAEWIIEISTEDTITYQFVPQVFTDSYVKAWNEYTKDPENPCDVFLVIEEINRGNCAQIFGDLFQLLDRKEDDTSEYPVKADNDLINYLLSLKGWNEEHPGIREGNLCLPPNLFILATMNTSDQSLFPMDSAFKRRWEWKFVPTCVKSESEKILTARGVKDKILYRKETDEFTLTDGLYEYKWSEFLKEINKRIESATRSDDKKLGFWFIKPAKDKKSIDADTFVSKVIFYLWNDIFKDMGDREFNPFAIKTSKGNRAMHTFSSFYDEYTGALNIGCLHSFMYNLGLNPELVKEAQDVIDRHIQEEGNPDA